MPAYYADGILCGAMGGLAAAEAIIRGADPAATAANAIRPIRRWNYIWWVETTKLAAVADRLMRISVPMAMVYPHSSSVNACATPLFASASVNGSVSLLRAYVDVRGTAPGMFATQ